MTEHDVDKLYRMMSVQAATLARIDERTLPLAKLVQTVSMLKGGLILLGAAFPVTVGVLVNVLK